MLPAVVRIFAYRWRRIKLDPTLIKGPDHSESIEINEPLDVYDTSGAYTDPEVTINLEKGLDRLRENWIRERGDTEQLQNFSSDFTRQRNINSATLAVFKNRTLPRKAPVWPVCDPDALCASGYSDTGNGICRDPGEHGETGGG